MGGHLPPGPVHQAAQLCETYRVLLSEGVPLRVGRLGRALREAGAMRAETRRSGPLVVWAVTFRVARTRQRREVSFITFETAASSPRCASSMTHLTPRRLSARGKPVQTVSASDAHRQAETPLSPIGVDANGDC